MIINSRNRTFNVQLNHGRAQLASNRTRTHTAQGGEKKRAQGYVRAARPREERSVKLSMFFIVKRPMVQTSKHHHDIHVYQTFISIQQYVVLFM